MSFRLGDWVVRKASKRNGWWPYGAAPVLVSMTSIDGNWLWLADDDTRLAWQSSGFNLIRLHYSDADLAMALQLADLIQRDYTSGLFNSHDLCVMARADCHDPEATWLRAQVALELLKRGCANG